MSIRIASMVLSFAGLFALLSGVLLWMGIALNFVSMHMLLGLLAVIALWVIGIAQAFSRAGSWLIAGVALLLGAAMAAIGMAQASLMQGELHWLIQVLHLILGLATIGLGHMAASRARKS